MKARLTLFFALLLVCTGTSGVFALGTPDHLPPALETVCDMETGAAYGHCNAYCEAMDCELANDNDPLTEPHASATACSKVRSKFQQTTGRDLPCESPCPCNDVSGPFHDTVAGEIQILACFNGAIEGLFDDGTVVVDEVTPPLGINLSGSIDGQWFCGIAGPDGVLPISPEQGQFCADLLEQAAASQGVPCVPAP